MAAARDLVVAIAAGAAVSATIIHILGRLSRPPASQAADERLSSIAKATRQIVRPDPELSPTVSTLELDSATKFQEVVIRAVEQHKASVAEQMTPSSSSHLSAHHISTWQEDEACHTVRGVAIALAAAPPQSPMLTSTPAICCRCGRAHCKTGSRCTSTR
jgi:hypothetical protein